VDSITPAQERGQQFLKHSDELIRFEVFMKTECNEVFWVINHISMESVLYIFKTVSTTIVRDWCDE